MSQLIDMSFIDKYLQENDYCERKYFIREECDYQHIYHCDCGWAYGVYEDCQVECVNCGKIIECKGK